MNEELPTKFQWLEDVMIAMDKLDLVEADSETRALYWSLRDTIRKWIGGI